MDNEHKKEIEQEEREEQNKIDWWVGEVDSWDKDLEVEK